LKGGSTYTYNTSNCTGGGSTTYLTIGPGGSVALETVCTQLTYNLTFSEVTTGTAYSIDVDLLYNAGGYDHTDTGTVTGVVS
jgi:hypothetical protein